MRQSNNLLAGSTTLLVLSLLAPGDKYGYEMIAALEEKSDHTFTLKEGTLYPILHSLEKEGAVTAYEKEAPSGRKRKYYAITPRGRERIGEFLVEWQDVQKAYGYIAASQEETGGTGGTP